LQRQLLASFALTGRRQHDFGMDDGAQDGNLVLAQAAESPPWVEAGFEPFNRVAAGQCVKFIAGEHSCSWEHFRQTAFVQLLAIAIAEKGNMTKGKNELAGVCALLSE